MPRFNYTHIRLLHVHSLATVVIASGAKQRCAVTAFFALRQKTDKRLWSSRSPVRPHWVYRNGFLPSQWNQPWRRRSQSVTAL